MNLIIVDKTVINLDLVTSAEYHAEANLRKGKDGKYWFSDVGLNEETVKLPYINLWHLADNNFQGESFCQTFFGKQATWLWTFFQTTASHHCKLSVE